MSDEPYGDALTRPYWEAAARLELDVQRCHACGHTQLYPRPFCLACYSDQLEWTRSAGFGTIYSKTTVRIPVSEELQPPYVVALVDLDEGPRLLTNVISECEIGQRVRVRWRDRDAAPPLPVFEVIEEEG